MADERAKLILEGEDAGASSVIEAVSGGLGGMTGLLAGLGGAAVIGGAVAGVGAVGAAALSMSTDVDVATDRVQTQLGLTGDEASAMGEIIEDVFANNFGASFDDVGQALTTVQQQMNRTGQLTDEQLQLATERALGLRDAFEVDVGDSTNAINTLMEQFGLTADEAFDFVTAGMQRGLNNSGDFLETIGEYSTQFADADATAGEFFSLMESGMQGGVLGTDRAADAFKEFRLRVSEMGPDATAAFDALSGPSEDLVGQIESGQITMADAFQMMMDRLGDLDDPLEQARLGTALFGTQFEDLGTEAALGIDLATTSMEDLAGSSESLNAQYDNWPAMWEGIKRSIGDALLPLGELLRGALEDAMPYIQDMAAWLGEKIPEAIEWFRGTWEEVAPVVQEVIGQIAAWWDEHGQGIIDTAMRIWDLVTLYFGGVWENVRGLFDAFRSAFSGDFEGFGSSIGEILMNSIETALALLAGLWGLVQPWLSELWTNFSTWFAETDWRQVGLDVIEAIADAISGFWGVVQPWLSELWTNFSTWFAEMDWAQLGYDVVTAIMNALDTLWGEWLPALGQLLIDVGNWFAEQDWASLASDVIDGIVQGITNGASAVAGALTDLASGMWQAWQDWWENHSPSRRMVDSAQDITSGVAVGLQDTSAIDREMDNLQGLISQPLGGPQVQLQGAAATGGAFGRRGGGGRGGDVIIERLEINSVAAANMLLAFLEGQVDERALLAYAG